MTSFLIYPRVSASSAVPFAATLANRIPSGLRLGDQIVGWQIRRAPGAVHFVVALPVEWENGVSWLTVFLTGANRGDGGLPCVAVATIACMKGMTTKTTKDAKTKDT